MTEETPRAFVDTNVILRILTADEADQTKAAVLLLERAMRGEITLYANVVVAVEMVWTLESRYRLPKAAIRSHLEAVLNTPGLVFEHRDLLLDAVDLFVRTNVNFADAYAAVWAQSRGLTRAFTFDTRHFGRLGFEEVRAPA